MAERVHLVSLGCPKNRVDSEVMVGKLVGGGFELVDDPEQADVIVVNTCSFIQPATEESIDTVLEMAGYKQSGSCRKLVVTGCMVQRFGTALEDELPEVDHFLGTGEYHRITDVLAAREGAAPRSYVDTPLYIHDELAPRLNSWKPHSAYLKISEGCDHRCAFCIIPQLRGKMRSRTIPSLVAEAGRLASQGVVELNLVSQDSTAFGRDLADGTDLGGLLRGLARVDGIEWIRLHYAYPIGLPESLLRAIAEEDKVCSYLDMPLQHASGPMLKAMRRGVTRAGQERILDRVRRFVPDVAIRTTFIVGFPGETDADFAELLDFVQAQRFDRVGVFTYCQEEGTPAAELPGQVPDDVKAERQAALMAAQADISRAALTAQVGRTLRVLVDGPDAEHPDVLTARTATQAPEVDGVVFLDGPGADVVPGRFVDVRITQAADHDLVGRVLPG
ncbi:MAG: 30S ribosomal protein S12 methylthiotransferase RimO [Alphaproteobacteria bacterium]|nr:30S ribosomal protein S12 methylthiotransferase RimO [Alphaproteobacteria bacterium]